MPEPRTPPTNGDQPQPHPLLNALQERINRAYQEVNEMNRALRPGEQPYVPPVDVHQSTAGFNVLLHMLMEAGVIDETDFTVQKGVAWAQLAEEWIAAVRERRKQGAQVIMPAGVRL